MLKEIWKDIKGYEGLYQVSDLGRIKRCEKIIKGYAPNGEIVDKKLKAKILKPCQHKSGYYQIKLVKNKKRKMYLVHRLVALTFIPNPFCDKFDQVNHMDRNRKNNKVTNLEWTNNSGNQKYSYLFKDRKRVHLIGENHPIAKLNEYKVKEIKKLLKSKEYTHQEISNKFKVSRQTISLINENRIWKFV